MTNESDNKNVENQSKNVWRSSILSDHKDDSEHITFASSFSGNSFIKKASIFTGILLLCIGMAAFFYYKNRSVGGEIPLILADATPHKVKAENVESHKKSDDKSFYGQLQKPITDEKITVNESEPDMPQVKTPQITEDFFQKHIDSNDASDDESSKGGLIKEKPEKSGVDHFEKRENESSKSDNIDVLKEKNQRDSTTANNALSPSAIGLDNGAIDTPKDMEAESTNNTLSSHLDKIIEEKVSENSESKPIVVSDAQKNALRKAESNNAYEDLKKNENLPNNESSESVSSVLTNEALSVHEEPKGETIEHAGVPITTSVKGEVDNSKHKNNKISNTENSPSDSRSYVVQVASLKSEDSAKKTWIKLQESSLDLLGKKEHAIQKVDLGRDRGIFYRVIVVGFNTKDDAVDFCAQLKRNGLDCFSRPR